jgi:hypothetical protein
MNLKNTIINWLARRLPACKDVTRLASDTMERKLSLRQRFEFKLHLMICSLCMRYVLQLRAMHEIAHQHAARMETGAAKPSSLLSPAARERMKRAMQA